MCKECGQHEPDAHVAAPDVQESRPHRHVVDLERRVLARNDHQAQHNRELLAERGVVALNLMSAPGSGKTLLLERTLEALEGRIGCAVIVGDVATDRDARRLAGKGAPIRQIETGSSCHLDAGLVGSALPEVLADGVRLLFIENVGNLVCPAAFDLGERLAVAVVSVAEGDDKPLKYPAVFARAELAVVTKTDLLPHVPFDMERCRQNLRRLAPEVAIYELSALTGQGLEAWLGFLGELASGRG